MNLIAMSSGMLLLLIALPAASSDKFAATPGGEFWPAVEMPARTGGLRLAALSPEQRFDDECGQCHGAVAEFVADSLTVKDGVLTGWGSEMPVFEFLQDHRGLQLSEAEFYRDLLQRAAAEAGLL